MWTGVSSKHVGNSPQEFARHVAVTVVQGASVSGISRTPRVARISWVAEVAKVAQALIHNHVFVELPDILSGEFVHVRAVELADRLPIHRVDIAVSPEPDCA